jgi:hypothetical protein
LLLILEFFNGKNAEHVKTLTGCCMNLQQIEGRDCGRGPTYMWEIHVEDPLKGHVGFGI